MRLLARYFERCYDPRSRCAFTGISLHDLRKMGDRLSIDRIVPEKGYVARNMRLVSLYLNNQRGIRRTVPVRAVRHLLSKLDRIVVSRLSHVKHA